MKRKNLVNSRLQPLVAAAFDMGDFVCAMAISVLLVIVSFGAYFITKSAERWDAYQILLQQEDFTKEKKENRSNRRRTENWKDTGILWACAGVLYAALCGLYSFFAKRKKKMIMPSYFRRYALGRRNGMLALDGYMWAF